jgi:hypothetical protein
MQTTILFLGHFMTLLVARLYTRTVEDRMADGRCERNLETSGRNLIEILSLESKPSKDRGDLHIHPQQFYILQKRSRTSYWLTRKCHFNSTQITAINEVTMELYLHYLIYLRGVVLN